MIFDREIFNLSVLIAFILGLIINLIWDFALINIQKKSTIRITYDTLIDMHEINQGNNIGICIKSALIIDNFYL